MVMMGGLNGDASRKGKVFGNWDRQFPGITYLVAMPEHLASVFKATRSPSKIFRTGPLTVAQWVMGVMD